MVSVLPGMVTQLLAPITLLVTTMVGPEPPLSTSSMPAPLITNSVPRPVGVGSTLPPQTSLAQPLSPSKLVCPVVELSEVNPHMTCFFDIFFTFLASQTHTHTHFFKKILCSGHCFEFLSIMIVGSPGGSVVKNLPANVGASGDLGLIPELERSPGGGHGNPLQYSCLGNPMDRGA